VPIQCYNVSFTPDRSIGATLPARREGQGWKGNTDYRLPKEVECDQKKLDFKTSTECGNEWSGGAKVIPDCRSGKYVKVQRIRRICRSCLSDKQFGIAYLVLRKKLDLRGMLTVITSHYTSQVECKLHKYHANYASILPI